MDVIGFHNADGPDGAIAKCMESVGLDDLPRTGTEGLIHLAIFGSSYTDERLEELASSFPEGQLLWAFSPTSRTARHERLKLTHVPAGSDREFVGKIARHLERFVNNQPKGTPLNPSHPSFPYLHESYDGLANYVPNLSGRHTVTIEQDGLPFDFYFDPKPETGRLVVMGQDAITRSRTPLPWFFRWKWAHEINASVIIWSDPTLHLDDSLDGAWWIGSKDRDLVLEGAQVVDRIAHTLGVTNDQVLHVGMSAGGFSAMQMATLMLGTRALVDIPRVTLQAHGARGATADQAVRSCLGFSDAHAVSEEYLPRVDVLSRMASVGRTPEFKYFQNMRDAAHVDSQYRMFREAIQQHPDYDPTRHVFHEYSQWHLSKGGHFPLKRSSMIAEIHAMLDRQPGLNSVAGTPQVAS